MDKETFINSLLGSHRNLMEIVQQDNPMITFKAKLYCCEKIQEMNKLIFIVQSTSNKINISRLVEEKVYIKNDKQEFGGIIIEGYDDKMVILARHRMNSNTPVLIRRNPNYNNEILLKEAEAFIGSGKIIHPCIYKSYNSPSCNDIEIDSISYVHKISFFNDNLNESQRNAVICSVSSNEPFKILGPPGTGKTETIIEIISQNLLRKKTIIVCGPSNTSVDNIISRFITCKYNENVLTSFYRLGSSVKGLTNYNLAQMANKAVEFMEKEDNEKNYYKERSQRKQEFTKRHKMESPLVFSTLFSSLKENFFFDLCIVDEACQATQLECFMGIVKAKNFILVGDPNQLSPSTSSLYSLLNLYTFILNEQYRMHSDLLKFSNRIFYKNMLVSPKQDTFKFFNQSRILFIDTAFFNFEEESSSLSKINKGEALIIKDIVQWIGKDKDIGIIAPYSAQVLYLREIVDCPVETVDGFQGQEKDFIILSFVRSNVDCQIGFLNDKKRINVALTRCKTGLIIIGDSQNFVKDPFLRSFFNYLENNAYVIDPDTFRLLINRV